MTKTSARKTGTKKRQVGKKSKPAGKASAAKSRASKSSAPKAAATKSSAGKVAVKKPPATKTKAVVINVPKAPEAMQPIMTAPQSAPLGKGEIVSARPSALLSIKKKTMPNTSDSKSGVATLPAVPPAAARSSVRAAGAKQRADMPPEQGFSVVVDGHHKALHDSKAEAMADGLALKQRFPFLRVEVFDASKKARFSVG